MLLLRLLNALVIALQFRGASAQKILTADQVPPGSTYNFDSDSRCRLSSHRSAILHNEDHNILVIDGGYGKFRIGEDEVQDLNPWTVAFDLSEAFDTPGLEPLWQVKKTPKREPVVTRGSIWTDSTQNSIYIQGGVFFDGYNVSKGEYRLNKTEYPEYSIWKFDVGSKKWENITGDVAGDSGAVRTYAGTAVSVPGTNESFYFGGITDPFTSPTTPMDIFNPTSQMLHFDAGNMQLNISDYYSRETDRGYWQGTLDHIPIGCGNHPGFLISIMSQSLGLNDTGEDVSSNADENGDPVSMDSVWLYDIEAEKWYEQGTLWHPNAPPPRTRYCSAVAYDKEAQTYDLWIHGGQLLGNNKSSGVADVWVLSMPSFRWTRLETAIPDVNSIRSHTCHAIGGQLVIVGGFPLGEVPPYYAPCDSDYIKIMDMNSNAPGWLGSYRTDSIYVSPDAVRNATYGQRKPLAETGWADEALESAFSCAFNPRRTSKVLSKGAIAGISVSVVLALLAVLIALGGYFYVFRRQHPRFTRLWTILQKGKKVTGTKKDDFETAEAAAPALGPQESHGQTSTISNETLKAPAAVVSVLPAAGHQVAAVISRTETEELTRQETSELVRT